MDHMQVMSLCLLPLFNLQKCHQSLQKELVEKQTMMCQMNVVLNISSLEQDVVVISLLIMAPINTVVAMHSRIMVRMQMDHQILMRESLQKEVFPLALVHMRSECGFKSRVLVLRCFSK
ncbi:hypothetical protein QVD17_12752 [Tagetes erecta]|uniref:Uncharacterized protein n=1 Tax=Tagetes erecta TaxID=13708 RepID=A0AAD8KV63_TARER|nr:hypothetical protein QVD17_12752 [Tagetes erecta]